MISLQNVAMSYGPRILFDDVNLHLSGKNRYGLVGANGAGKSTFLRVLTKEDEPFLGDISIPKDSKMGWLKQDQHLFLDCSLISILLRGKPKLWRALEKKEQILEKPTLSEKDIEQLGEVEEEIGRQDGYAAEAQAESLLLGLGIPIELHHKPLKALSGGYKLRVLLARTLYNDPDILLLDEPTNYLDIVTINWLADYLLRSFNGLVLLVSHDHHFINKVCNIILDIDYGEIRAYPGNYENFCQQKVLVQEQKEKFRKSQQKYVDRMQVFIERFRAKPSKSKQATSREKQLEKLEWPKLDVSSRKYLNLKFQTDVKSGKVVLKLKGISKNYPGKEVLKPLNLVLHQGEKIAVLGVNGVGKSTLVKLILKEIEPTTGTVEWGYNVKASYFAQESHEHLSGPETIIEWLENHTSQITEQTLRRTLGKVLFTQDDQFKTLNVLSGGEKARLVLAKIMLEKPNLIVLDEPTNHLDLEGRESLAKALRNYDGTALFVTHDQCFVESSANRILYIKKDEVLDYAGTYLEFINKHEI